MLHSEKLAAHQVVRPSNRGEDSRDAASGGDPDKNADELDNPAADSSAV